MNPNKRTGIMVVIGICFSLILFLICWGLSNYSRAKSLAKMGEADYVLNNGREVKAIDYEVIIDQDTGIEYLYFPGLGVTPYLDENGEVLRVVE